MKRFFLMFDKTRICFPHNFESFKVQTFTFCILVSIQTQYVQLVHTLGTARAHTMYSECIHYVQLGHTLCTASASTMYN